MLGAIIGDIVGSRWEFNPTNDYNFELFSDKNGFTDDTICTVAVADAILRDKDFGETIHEWCNRYPHPMGGYGGRFAQWVYSKNPQPYGSFGNGAAMRVSPVAWAKLNAFGMMSMAKKTAECTHNHPEGIKGAQTVALAIHHAIEMRATTSQPNAQDVAVILDKCVKFSGYNINIKKESVINRFDETCQGTVPVALWIIGQSTSFEDAIRRAVSLGADADTLGAIVGSIAEAIWGIPEEMQLKALKYLPNDMKNVLLRFYNRFGENCLYCSYGDEGTTRETMLEEEQEEIETKIVIDDELEEQFLASKEEERQRRYTENKWQEEKAKQDGTYARALIKGFIKEKLDGDINKIATFDFGSLREDQKYGDCKGFAFSVDKCNIMIAIMSVVFEDVWPELNQYNIERYKYLCNGINYTQYLFGANIMDKFFKGMDKFNPTKELHERAVRVYHLTDYIGNIWVLPGGIDRDKDTYHYHGYADLFLKWIYAAMTGNGKVQPDLKAALYKNRKLMAGYQGSDGFRQFALDMMLNDYIDYYGKPIDLFMHVWSMMKGLKPETYFKAVDEYCDFMEQFVPKRGRMIVEKLKKKLD